MAFDLHISNLHVTVEKKQVLHGVNLKVQSKKLHVVMGPNGSGKSSLTLAIMGHPNYLVSKGTVMLGKKNLLKLEPHLRARAGVILGFQNPIAVPGVTLFKFLRAAYAEIFGKKAKSVLEFHKEVLELTKLLQLDPSFLKRSLNEGFSGGEKKKAEMLQLLALKPKFVILDEIDTGLDVDALKTVAHGVNLLIKQGSGVLIITHYQRILNYLHPDRVHILISGKIVKEGDETLASLIEKQGYGKFHRAD